MLKVENVEVLGWEHAIRGMRNPKNSWAKSDSGPECPYGKEKCCGECQQNFCIGPNDKQLMMALRNAGTDHRKFMRMITVYLDITAPLYWWKEFDTYKVGTVANSCSTMHKIAAKEFTLDDFSHEHLVDDLDVRIEIGGLCWRWIHRMRVMRLCTLMTSLSILLGRIRKMKAKRALCMLAAILLVVAMMLMFLTGCNRQVIDTTFSYDNAILVLPDGSVISGKIESWKDYDDGDQIQVKIDGTTYLVHSVNIVLIKE